MTTEPKCPRCLQVISPDETVELDGARVTGRDGDCFQIWNAERRPFQANR